MTTSMEPIAIDNVGNTHAESFPIRDDRVAPRTLGPGRVARLVARLRAGSLDRKLIAGADPASSPQLAARAARLTAPRTRALIAEGLDGLLQAAHGPKQRWSAVGRRDALLANAEEISDLAALLHGDVPLRARGIAMLSELLSDGAGPAYHGGREELARHLGEARVAMRR
ncbi:MAG TPA: hypothetical protein VKG38_20320 [Solirubrobacteraceae bacterium]|nr:hypothetical protein [Solirubrobacteraceae bacterium]